MAYQDFGVSDFLEIPELLRDFVDRARDQRFRRHAAVAAAQRLLQYRVRFIRRLADINVAPQHDRAGLSVVNGAALAIEIGLRAGLLAGKAGARNPALRQPSGAVDGRRRAGSDMDLDGLRRTQREARSGDPKSPGGTHCAKARAHLQPASSPTALIGSGSAILALPQRAFTKS